MAMYSVYMFCDECGEVHPMGIAISLNDGPVEKASIGDTYAGKELNPKVTNLRNNSINCPNTGKLTKQEDNNQLFLVPIGD